MVSSILVSPDTEKAVLDIANKKPRFNDVVPERFIQYLESFDEQGYIRNEEGICRRNPLIVALGDSVTQGCFEGNLNYSKRMMEEFYPDGERIQRVIDSENVYHEKFRKRLAAKYNVPVSVINSGIGGDNVINMYKRLDRDVLQYSPHLVLINASLNGPAGDLAAYEKHIRAIINNILDNTSAEIVLITPNMVTKSWMRDLEGRVDILRKIGIEKHLSIADAYAVWKEIEAYGINIDILLANRINHPVIVGHEIYCIELMKLFDK